MNDKEFIGFMEELAVAPDGVIKRKHMERMLNILKDGIDLTPFLKDKNEEITKLQDVILELNKENQIRKVGYESDLAKSNSAKDEYYARLCKIVDERDELKEKLASVNSKRRMRGLK